MDGNALIRDARAGFADLPIIPIVGSAGDSAKDLPTDIVTLYKPFEPDQLLDAVAARIGRPA